MNDIASSNNVGSAPDIAFVLPSLSGGGAERVFLDLANGLAERGHRVDLVLLATEGAYLDMVSDKVRLVLLDAPGRLKAVFLLARYLRSERPQRLLSTLLVSNVVTYLARTISRQPAKMFLREANSLASYLPRSSLKKRLFARVFLRAAYEAADGIVAVSDGVAAELRSFLGVRNRNLVTIYNPFAVPAGSAECHAHPFFASGGPVVIAAGRLAPQKRFDLLIEAFGKLEDHSARLIIFGDGPDRPTLERQIVEAGLAQRVSLPGFEKDIVAAMRSADLFVLSSDYEGLPNVLIQALSCDLPVVATDCPSGPSEILEGGRYGRLVPPGDACALAAAMEAALKDDEKVDFRRAIARFAPEQSLNAYAQFIGLHVPQDRHT